MGALGAYAGWMQVVAGSGKPQLLEQVWVLVHQRCQRIAHGEHGYTVVLEEHIVPARKVTDSQSHHAQCAVDVQPDPARLLVQLHGASWSQSML